MFFDKATVRKVLLERKVNEIRELLALFGSALVLARILRLVMVNISEASRGVKRRANNSELAFQ